MTPRHWLVVAAICGALGVGLGAFGAHGLKTLLKDRFADDLKEQAYLEGVWETGANYHLLHAVAIAATVPLMLHSSGSKMPRLAATFFLAGIVIFSGSLYTLVLADLRIMGAITPIGGMSMIVGWIVLAFTPVTSSTTTQKNP